MIDRTGSSRRTKVLLVGPSLAYLGGQAVQAQRLLSRLQDDKRLSVDFLPVDPELPWVFGRLQRIKYVRTLLTSAAYLVSLLRRVPGADVVHAYSASYWSFLLAPLPAIIVARLTGRPVILNYHSGEAADHLARWKGTRRLLMLADRIVVPNEYLKGIFAQHGLEASCIANHVEPGEMPVRIRSRLRPAFLSNRNLETHYGVDCVLRAFHRIQEAYPEASLVLVGDGSRRAELEMLARSLGLQNVSFIGAVPPRRMPAYYNAADIYLNGSRIDNMPLSLMEAFAAGLPVVTTDAGGIPHIVRHERNALMVPVDDIDGLAQEAVRLLRDPDMARSISRGARTESIRKFGWSAVAAKWRDCYRRMAGHSPADPPGRSEPRGIPVGAVSETPSMAAARPGEAEHPCATPARWS